jgi:type II secretory pathway pseudopilin PulG
VSAVFARQRGLSKFEFAVVVGLIGILAAVLLDRLNELEREAERLEVELALRNLRMGLRLAISEKVIRGEEAGIGALLDADPLEWLGAAPSKVGAGETAPRWRYDPATHTLHYRPRQPVAFADRDELAWRLAPIRDGAGRTTGIGIEPLK